MKSLTIDEGVGILMLHIVDLRSDIIEFALQLLILFATDGMMICLCCVENELAEFGKTANTIAAINARREYENASELVFFLFTYEN